MLNKLDGMVLINKELAAHVYRLLLNTAKPTFFVEDYKNKKEKTLNQLKKALSQDLSGWLAVPSTTTKDMVAAQARSIKMLLAFNTETKERALSQEYLFFAAAQKGFEAALEAAPPLPTGKDV